MISLSHILSQTKMDFFNRNTIVSRINGFKRDAIVWNNLLRDLESSDRGEDYYYQILELYETCGEMIELYENYLKRL